MTTEGATVIVMNLGKGKRALRPLEEIAVKVEPVDVDMDYDGSMDMFSPKQNGRKRQRLDHLSTEEKIMRRKMKNRVAAQSARDRKKALMDDLEDKVRHLENKLASYEKQNRELIAKNEHLCKRNEELMKRLQERELESKVSKSIIGQVESSSTETGHCAKAVGHAEEAGLPTCDRSVDDALRWLDDIEADQLFNALQDLIAVNNCDEPSTTGNLGKSPTDAAESATVRKMVGTAAECVESIKELIRFDHVYYKSEVEDHEAMPACALGKTRTDSSPSPLSKTPDLESIFAAEDEGMLDCSEEVDATPSRSPFSRLAADMSECDISETERWECKSESGYDSPCSDRSGADEGLWEESFVELFPSLA